MGLTLATLRLRTPVVYSKNKNHARVRACISCNRYFERILSGERLCRMIQTKDEKKRVGRDRRQVPLITCAILAGGLSRRMGKDKATLDFVDGSLIENVYLRAMTVFDKVIIVSSHHRSIQGVDAPVVGDVLCVKGSMVGIVSALMHAETPYVFVLACDMPLASEESMSAVIEAWEGEDIVIPKTNAGFEPLHALYSRSCISYMLNFAQQGRLRIRDMFPYVTVKIMENHPAFFAGGHPAFLNVNTKLELKKAEEIQRQKDLP
jgi:molybdopterin-guanine dinucleotide biosynthesis protein A